MSSHTGSAQRTRSLIGLSRWPEALVEVQQALAVNPSDSDLLSLLTTIHYAMGDYPAGLAAVERAIAAQWSRASSHAIRGLMLGKLLRFDEAVEALDVALSLEPDSATTHITYAELLLDRTIDEPPAVDQLAPHFAKTLRHANAAVRLEPGSGSAHRVLASAYVISNQPDRAEQSVRHALELEPNDVKSMHVLAVILESSGRTREAGDVFVAAGRLQPSSGVAARLAFLDEKPFTPMQPDQWFIFVALTVATMAGLAAGDAVPVVWAAAMLFLAAGVCTVIAVRQVRHRRTSDESLSPEARKIAQQHRSTPGSASWDDIISAARARAPE